MECRLSIRTVGINSVIRLTSRLRTRKDFPGHRRLFCLAKRCRC